MLKSFPKNQIPAAFIILFLSLGCASTGTKKPKEMTKSERAQFLLDSANGSLSENDPTGALQTLVVAQGLDPENAAIYHSEALAFYAKKDLASAVERAQKAVSLAKRYPDAENTLGKLLIDSGKPQQAIPYLMKAATDPLYREAYKSWTNLGIVAYRGGEYSKAKTYFDNAVTAAPVTACVAYYYRGHLHLKNSEFKLAVRDYDQATKKYCAAFVDAHLALGIAYEQSHEYDQARRKFLEIQSHFPNSNYADQAVSHLRNLP
jgi:Tfp pilus assembly protein PilF